jgi:hypothetical protein
MKDETKMPDDDIYLTPAEASEFLKRLGVSRAVTTLAKLRCIGGGPVFQSVGRNPRYRPHRLREYALSQMTPERTSSSGSTHRGHFGHRAASGDAPDAA